MHAAAGLPAPLRPYVGHRTCGSEATWVAWGQPGRGADRLSCPLLLPFSLPDSRSSSLGFSSGK